MNKSQQCKYRLDLWPAACAAQKWSVKDEAKRRAVTLEATGQETTAGLSEDQITALFDHLKWLADPYDLDKAMPVANPEMTWETNRRRQLVWVITHTAARGGLSDAYLTEASRAKCAALHCKAWQDMPLVELVKFAMTIKSRAKSARDGKGHAQPVQEHCTPHAGDEEAPGFMQRARKRLGTAQGPWR